jgi:hypothetical protein
MVYFQTKNFGTFSKALELKLFIGLFYDHLVNLICYIFPILVYCIKKNLATLDSTLLREKPSDENHFDFLRQIWLVTFAPTKNLYKEPLNFLLVNQFLL